MRPLKKETPMKYRIEALIKASTSEFKYTFTSLTAVDRDAAEKMTELFQKQHPTIEFTAIREDLYTK